MEEILKNYLNENEDVIETICPACNKLFGIYDIFSIPLSLSYGGLAIYFEFLLISYQAPVVFQIFVIPFIIFGLYMIFGRFFYNKWKTKNTLYIITNTRLIIMAKNILGRYKFASKIIKDIEKLKIEGNLAEIGSVVFENSFILNPAIIQYNFYDNLGLDLFWFNFIRLYGFYNIYNPKEVYDKIMEIKSA